MFCLTDFRNEYSFSSANSKSIGVFYKAHFKIYICIDFYHKFYNYHTYVSYICLDFRNSIFLLQVLYIVIFIILVLSMESHSFFFSLPNFRNFGSFRLNPARNILKIRGKSSKRFRPRKSPNCQAARSWLLNRPGQVKGGDMLGIILSCL